MNAPTDVPSHPGRLTIDAAALQRVNAALADVRAGKMVILVDDEDRENEGDLVLAGDAVTPAAINFMAMHGRGLICLALTEEQVEKLRLPMMRVPGRNGPPLGTAFTVSIEAASGVTTGISAADRAHTVKVAIAEDAKPEHVVTPGHVFPLRARPGGVLVRTGQTEGAVDLARLAGLRPNAVICEIMNDDGTMARMPDLEKFATKHGLRILTVADMIQYRLQTETLVRRLAERTLHLDMTNSDWRAVVYEALVERRQALALVKGDVASEDPILCRVHSGSRISDLFSTKVHAGSISLREAVLQIEKARTGVLLYLASQRTLEDELNAFDKKARPEQNVPAAPLHSSEGARTTLRRFGLGAQMLHDLGVRKLRLLTNSNRKIAGLTGYGLEIVEHVPLAVGEKNDD
ncbi:MAG TPA: 3,4-dihydroxy-2-butanone-4-phosphate synthase [Sorangium sp.]|nr:3,4-dihydroxy-2-butanone-4-phosphate synthase [Sorangium sp.]